MHAFNIRRLQNGRFFIVTNASNSPEHTYSLHQLWCVIHVQLYTPTHPHPDKQTFVLVTPYIRQTILLSFESLYGASTRTSTRRCTLKTIPDVYNSLVPSTHHASLNQCAVSLPCCRRSAITIGQVTRFSVLDVLRATHCQ